MWAAFFTSVLLSALRRPDEDEDEIRQRVLGMRPDQLPLFEESLVDWMVPVRVWISDGASLWRVVGRGVLEQVEAEIGKKIGSGQWASRDELLLSLDPSSWDDGDHNPRSAHDLYVYVEGDGLGTKPTALLLVEHPSAISSSLASDSVPFVTWPAGGLPKGSVATDRLYAYSEEKGWDMDQIRDLWGQTATVKDLVPTILSELKADLGQGGEGKAVIDRLDRLAIGNEDMRKLRTWAKDFVQLWWELQERNGLAADRKYWGRAWSSDPEVVERIRDIDEEIAKRIDGGEDEEVFDTFVRGQIEDIDHEIRSMDASMMKLAEEEADSASDLLYNLKLEVPKGSSYEDQRRIWELKMSWDSWSADSVDDLWLRQDDDGELTYDFRDVSVKGTTGALDSLLAAGYAETDSDRMKRTGTDGSTWDFPGPYQGVWEVWAMMGTVRPDAVVPLLMFLKVALDHGLLSEAAQRRYAKELLRWEDPMTQMVRHDLVR